MATVSNTLVGTGVQPKFIETGVWAIECTQALASNAASATTYELFYVSSGCKIIDLVVGLSAANSTAATKINVGYVGTANAFIATAAMDSAWYSRATGAHMFQTTAFTADTKVTADLVGATTAAGNLYVRALVTKSDNLV